LSTSTPPEPRSYDPASGTPRPAERTSILGRTGSSEPVDSEATQALPADWAAGQPATSVMPAGADGSAGEQPATSVMSAGAGEWSGQPPAAYAPAPAVQAPAASQWNQPMPQAQPMVQPQPAVQPQPEALPRRGGSRRRRTMATPIGTVLMLASVVLLGWGVYTLLTSFHVFDVVLNGAEPVDQTALKAIGAGALLAFVAVITAIVACTRARPKTAATLLLIGSLVLPLVATGVGAYYGGTQLKDQTVAEAKERGSMLDTSQIAAALDQVKVAGVNVTGPWRDELTRIIQNGGDIGNIGDHNGNGSGGGNGNNGGAGDHNGNGSGGGNGNNGGAGDHNGNNGNNGSGDHGGGHGNNAGEGGQGDTQG